MTRKTSDFLLNDAVEMYRSGFKTNEISAKLGISKSVLYRLAKTNGIDTSYVHAHKSFDTIKVMEMFNAGRGIGGIAKDLGIAASCVRLLLKEHGISGRNRSEQQQARMDNATHEQIKALTAKANSTMRGSKVAHDKLVKQAKTRFMKQSARSSYLEETFDELMRDVGYKFVRQFQIDKYNADFLFQNVVVEIFGGQWHWTGQHLQRSAQRIETILNSGYHLIIVAARNKGVSKQTRDKVIALLNEFSRDKTTIRHYRMIGSDGETLISRTSESDDLTIVWPFRNVRNSTNGRYSRGR